MKPNSERFMFIQDIFSKNKSHMNVSSFNHLIILIFFRGKQAY